MSAPLIYQSWSATHVGLDPRLGAHATRSVLLIDVETSDALVGLGQCVSASRNLKALEVLIRHDLSGYLIGEDAFARERIWQTAYRATFQHGRKGNTIAALSGLDIALWDLAGQALGAPIYQLLGAAHDSVPAYG